MHSDYRTLSLDQLGVLRVRGADALSFLQGQLSNDITRLAPERSLLAGFHNPQGRVIALLRLLTLAPEDLLALLPRELIAPVSARLAKFILRAKVKLADESAQWRITALLPPAESAHADIVRRAPAAAAWVAALPAAPGAATRLGTTSVVRLAGDAARWLALSPVSEPALPGAAEAGEPLAWQRLAVAAGEPQVYAATSEEFIAQMLNLDCLGAIAFDKGCYTGQEVIARAHYRGRVKRRMQRFATRTAAQLKPADAGTLADGRAFKVVEAVQLADGRCEFLAVTQLAGSPAAESLSSAPREAAPALEAEQLALPYALPE